MEIKSGKYDVFASGTVINFNNEPLIFQINAEMLVRFTFHENTETKEHKVDFKLVNSNELELQFFNFNNSVGIGNTNPINLGTVNERNLYLNYRIHALTPTAGKTVHYTWFLGEEVANAKS